MEMRVRAGAVAQGLAGPRGWAWASLLVRGDGDERVRGRCCAGVGRPEGMGVGVADGAWGWR